MKRFARCVLLGLFAIGLPLPSANAQANGARIDGIVSDSQALPLPGVKVVLTETRTGLQRATETSSSGTYEFPSLNPGQYKLDVQAKGFASELQDFTLEVNQALRLDLTLKVGQ